MSGTPVLGPLVEGLAGARPVSLRGILNATSNFILTAMMSGSGYDADGLDVGAILDLEASGRSIAEQPGAAHWPSAIDGMRATEADTEVEWRPVLPVVLGGGTTYRGHDGVREVLRDLDEIFEERRLGFSEIHDVGDRIVAVGNLTIRGKGSGLRTESPFGWLGEFTGGKATSIRTYLDPAEALEIAGLV